MTTFLSHLDNTVPLNWTEVPTGDLFAASGSPFSYLFKWDGQANHITAVGVRPPPDAMTLTWSGSGAISGTYTAYLRFVDGNGNVSNPSPISPTAVANNAAILAYSSIDTPSTIINTQNYTSDFDISRITRRQILRNTAGQTTTYYVDIDTTDLTSTTLYSVTGISGTAGSSTAPANSASDSDLTARTAVPAANLFLYGIPPWNKYALANHLGRVFAAGEVVFDQGCIQVTNGSSTVTPVAGYLSLPATLPSPARYLYVNGGLTPYTITGVVNPTAINAGQLTISPTYQGPTDKFAAYAIRAAATERRLVYYSQANLPEAWPATNAISIQEDGDDITGLMPFGSFLYILENHHIYRLTYQTDPGVDGGVFLALNRGCLNQRCWVIVEGTAYMLDDQGIHAYGGARDSEPISSTVQDLFRFSDSDLRVNWAASRWFHAVHYSSQEVIRWFVALSGGYLPYHALCYNYRQQRWWIEQWSVPIGCSALGRLGKSTRTPQVYLGTSAGRVVAMWQGTLDGPEPSAGTVRGTHVPEGHLDYINDATATFATANNNTVTIVDGTGKGQTQVIVATGSQQLKVKHPWRIKPDATSVYQLGGIPWTVQFGWWRTLLYEQLNDRYVALVFQPCTHAALATLRIFTDFSATPLSWQADYTLTDGNGVRTSKGSADVVIDMTKATGYVQKRFPGHREFFADGVRYLSLQLSGVTNTEPQRIYYVLCGGVEQG